MEAKFEINLTNSFYEDSLKEKTPFKNIEEIEIKDNQKISINSQNLLLTSYSYRRRSSDSTSISMSQTENLSQTSESSLTNQNTNNSKIINNGITKKDSVEEEQIDYFFGIEKYFYKIMPQKFCEYKKSKNYLPKRNLKELEKQKEGKVEVEVKHIKAQENNIINNNIPQNLFYSIYGNALLYYNALYFNYTYFNQQNNESNVIKEKEKNEKKSNDKIEVKKDEEINGNIFELKNEQDSDEDSVYIIKRQKNYKKNNKFNKDKSKIVNENNKEECNFRKSNYNCKYKCNYSQNNNNYKNYNNQLIYHNYNKKTNNYFCNINENNYVQKESNYNKNKPFKKRTRKVIYY
jgi:hypothetical protein